MDLRERNFFNRQHVGSTTGQDLRCDLGSPEQVPHDETTRPLKAGNWIMSSARSHERLAMDPPSSDYRDRPSHVSDTADRNRWDGPSCSAGIVSQATSSRQVSLSGEYREMNTLQTDYQDRPTDTLNTSSHQAVASGPVLYAHEDIQLTGYPQVGLWNYDRPADNLSMGSCWPASSDADFVPLKITWTGLLALSRQLETEWDGQTLSHAHTTTIPVFVRGAQ